MYMGDLKFGGARSTPYLQQSEASECGLACLAMVAGHHGYATDLIALRRKFPMSLKGSTLQQILETSDAIGLSARPMRGEVDDLIGVSLPAILHWDLNHFVVLTKVSGGIGGRRYHVHDPARGSVVFSKGEMSLHFTGVMLELTRGATFQPRREAESLRISQLWTSLSGFWPAIGQVALLSLLLQIASLAAPFYMQLGIDTVFPSFDRKLLAMLALGFGGLALINFLTGWLRSTILVTLNNALSYQIIVNLFRHLTRLPLPWFEKRHVGDIVSRFGSTKPITDMLSQGMIAAFLDGAMTLTTLALMIVYSPLLASVAIGALLVFGLLRLAFMQTLRLRNLNVITANAREASVFMESVRGIATVKAFGQEANRQRLWQQSKAEAVNAQIALSRLSAGFDAANQLVMATERVLFVYLAIGMALDARLTIGMIFAFQAYKDQFTGAVLRLIDQGINWSVLKMHLLRISDIALTQTEQLSQEVGPRTSHGAAVTPKIELRNVCFSYGVGEKPVLRGINLTIEPGAKVLLVGPSGCGKTTLLKIIMGLFEPTHGEVLIDDIPLQQYGLARWRSQCASVAQDDTLFAGTLGDNIAMFAGDADQRRIETAADAAGVAAEINAMPMRYDSLVGDMGSALSGGQRQRIMIARALHCEPAVLLLDEGTAHIDRAAAARLADRIRTSPFTVLSIAHDIANFAGYRTVELDQGLLKQAAPAKPRVSFSLES